MAHAPQHLRKIVVDADAKFPVRLTLAVPPNGFAGEMSLMLEWLRREVGDGSYAWTTLRSNKIDAACVYFADMKTATAFVERWPLAPLVAIW